MAVNLHNLSHTSSNRLSAGNGTAGALRAHEIEAPPSILRIMVEAIFYFVLTISTFIEQIGVSKIDNLAGAIVTAAGLFTFIVILIQREKLSASFLFMLAIVIAGNFSQVFGNGETPIVGEGLPPLLHGATLTLIFCYLVRNQAAEKRVIFIVCAVIIVTTVLFGEFIFGRLSLENVGGTFSNANDLAYSSGLFGVALLFRSLHSDRKIKILFWTISLVLIFICLRTVSRGGILALGCGLWLFFLTMFIGRQKARNIFFLTTTGIIVACFFSGVVTERMTSIAKRMEETESFKKRAAVFKEDPLGDMRKTLIFGKGPEMAETSAGVTAHNTFLHTHITYGGPAAYIYLLWLLWMIRAIVRVVFNKNIKADIKFMVVAIFLVMFVSQMVSNNGYLFLSSCYVVGVVDKYTYSPRKRFVF